MPITGPEGRSAPLITPRTALVLLLAVLAGLGAAALTVWAPAHVAAAVLLGVGTTATAAGFFNWIISRR